MPLLVGDALVGRFDLKADRQAGVLLVQAAWAEPGGPPPRSASGQSRNCTGWPAGSVWATSSSGIAATCRYPWPDDSGSVRRRRRRPRGDRCRRSRDPGRRRQRGRCGLRHGAGGLRGRDDLHRSGRRWLRHLLRRGDRAPSPATTSSSRCLVWTDRRSFAEPASPCRSAGCRCRTTSAARRWRCPARRSGSSRFTDSTAASTGTEHRRPGDRAGAQRHSVLPGARRPAARGPAGVPDRRRHRGVLAGGGVRTSAAASARRCCSTKAWPGRWKAMPPRAPTI